MILRYRKYLPHLESPNSTYFVTFRLEGALPQSVLENWRFERVQIQSDAERQKRQLTDYEKDRLKYLFSRKVEEYLDQLYGECWLKERAVAQVVVDTLRHFDGSRYLLHAWCVMPNHVHVVFTAISKSEVQSDLIPIVHSWKSYTAHKANKILKRTGTFWQGEYYDHRIRYDEEFAYYVDYTLQNPVKAGLCKHWREWRWSGCSETTKRWLSD
jgi:REP element-mobilizing transposase RayT